jgi:hypothetical protein
MRLSAGVASYDSPADPELPREVALGRQPITNAELPQQPEQAVEDVVSYCGHVWHRSFLTLDIR